MHEIDINSQLNIDLSKCYLDHDRGFDTNIEEWNKVANAEDPTLFTITGLIDIDDNYVAINMFNAFKSNFERTDRHFAQIPRPELIHLFGDKHLKIKLPKNMAVLDEIADVDEFPDDHDPFNDNKLKKIASLQLPHEIVQPEQLKDYFWVTINVPDKLTPLVVNQLHEILLYCIPRNIPVWCPDQKIREAVFGTNSIKVGIPGTDLDNLYFDLPANKFYSFIDFQDKFVDNVRRLGDAIVKAHIDSKIKAMEVGYGLLRLDITARLGGKAQFWNSIFGVKNRSEYCKLILGISPDQGSQYLRAAHNVEKLKPGFLKQFFQTGSDQSHLLTRGYTFYRAIEVHVKDLADYKDHPDYPEVEEMIMGSDLSSREVLELLPEKIAAITGVKSEKVTKAMTASESEVSIEDTFEKPIVEDGNHSEPEQEYSIAEEPFDAIDFINEFRRVMGNHIPGSFTDKFVAHCEDILLWVSSSESVHTEEIRVGVDPNAEFEEPHSWDR